MKASKILAALLALVLLAAACGGSDDSDVTAEGDEAGTEESSDENGTSDDAGDAADETSEEAGEGDSADPAADVDADALYDELFGIFADPEASQDMFAEQQREAEELTRTCMAEQGFEYIPIDYSQEGAFGGEFDEDEFTATYGYGISTFLDEMLDGDPFGGDFVDPNQAITDAMTEGERNAYYEALYGETEEFDSTIETDPDDFSFEPKGCQGAGFELMNDSFAVFDSFSDEIDDAFERAQADPRLVEFAAEWSECMSDAGYEYANQEAAIEDIAGQAEEFQSILFGGFGAFGSSGSIEVETVEDPLAGLSEAEIDELTDEDFADLFQMPELDPEQAAALDALQEYELAVAAADAECTGDTDLLTEVFEEYMRNFVAENAAEISAVAGS